MREKVAKMMYFAARLTGVILAVSALLALFQPIYTAGGEIDRFLMLLLIGFPFGVGKMLVILSPVRCGVGESVGVLAVDFILGGLAGIVFLGIIIVKNCFGLIKAVID